MESARAWMVSVAAAVLSLVLASATPVSAQQVERPVVAIDGDDTGGVVTGPNGPEAGVWVIAETTELPTKYAKRQWRGAGYPYTAPLGSATGASSDHIVVEAVLGYLEPEILVVSESPHVLIDPLKVRVRRRDLVIEFIGGCERGVHDLR
jgi:hypothetical protein